MALRRTVLRCFLFAAVLCLITARADAFAYQERISLSKSLAHYAMGQVYDLLGMTNRAVLEYEQATQFDDSGYLIRLRLGTDYARLNMLKEAVDQLQLVTENNSEDMQSHYLLALIYSSQQEYEKAAAEYEFILKSFSAVEPQNIEIYGYLAQLYYSQRKYDQAILQFEKILQIEPDNADVMYLLGSLYLEVNNKPKAKDLLEQSLKQNPDHDGSLNTLGYMYAEEGKNLDEATRLIEHALTVSPDNGAYLDSLGWVYYQKGQYDKALETLLKADQLLKDPVIYEHLGDVYYKMNKFDEAVENWQRSLELSPDQESIKAKISDVKNIEARTNR